VSGATLVLVPFLSVHGLIWHAIILVFQMAPFFLIFLCSPLVQLLKPAILADKVASLNRLVVWVTASMPAEERYKELAGLGFRKWPCLRGAVLLLACMVANAVLQSLIDFASHPLFSTLWVSILIGSIFPITGALAFRLGQRISPEPDRALKSGSSLSMVQRRKDDLIRAGRGFLTQTYPYLSFRFGFITSCVLASFMPWGLGHSFAGWLHASLVDADMASSAAIDPLFAFLVNAMTANFTLGA